MVAPVFHIEGEAQIRELLAKIERFGGDHSRLYAQLGDVLLEGVHDRFNTGTAPDGSAWQKSWRAIAQSGQTLRDTGRLLNSIHVRTLSNGVALSTNVVYARVHQFGATIRPKNGRYLTFKTPTGSWRKVGKVTVPARPFFGVSEADAAQLIETMQHYLEGLMHD